MIELRLVLNDTGPLMLADGRRGTLEYRQWDVLVNIGGVITIGNDKVDYFWTDWQPVPMEGEK